MYGIPLNSIRRDAARAPRLLPEEGFSGRGRGSSARPVLDQIRRLVQSLRRAAQKAKRQVGLSSAQLFVLQKLSEARALSVNALAERTATDQSSVSVVIARLAEKGLVARRPDPKDRRRVRLSLTSRGRSLLHRSPAPPQNQLLEAIEALRPHERETLAALLGRIVARMGEVPATLFFEPEEKARASSASRTNRRADA
jgi:DNA-binding MarR family transcriptional regulator